MPDPPPLGLILAGGEGRRLGGRDKASVLLGGQTLLAHVAARLGPQCSGLVLNANGDPARFAACGFPVIADGLPGRPGPLAGILAGLDWAATHRPQTREVASVAVDTPFLPDDFVLRLVAAKRATGAAVVCAASGGKRHPVAALWSVSVRTRLRDLLVGEGERRVGAALDRVAADTVAWDAEPGDPFFNINTPDDLARAGAWLSGGAG